MKAYTIAIGYLVNLEFFVTNDSDYQQIDYIEAEPDDLPESFEVLEYAPSAAREEKTFILARQRTARAKDYRIYIFDYDLARRLVMRVRENQSMFVNFIAYRNIDTGELWRHDFSARPKLEPITKKMGFEVKCTLYSD